MSNDTPPASGSGGRGRGRPRIGVPVITRLTEADLELIKSLGDGVEAAGLRRAVRIVLAMSPAEAKEAALRLEAADKVVQPPRPKRSLRKKATEVVPTEQLPADIPATPFDATEGAHSGFALANPPGAMAWDERQVN